VAFIQGKWGETLGFVIYTEGGKDLGLVLYRKLLQKGSLARGTPEKRWMKELDGIAFFKSLNEEGGCGLERIDIEVLLGQREGARSSDSGQLSGQTDFLSSE